ncbi:MAG TPA: hypothetical protein VH083_08990 [Myxococcales bacterium]|jgi:hypothetical protein|nr:hypothetical protein [Myxococcales bacterium]
MLALIGLLLAVPSGDELILRPVAGLSVVASDSGPGVGAELGIRIDHVLLRGLARFGGNNGNRGFFSSSLRADWLVPLGTSPFAFFAGPGVGWVSYGFLLDDPARTTTVLTPAVGLIFRPDAMLGRIILELEGEIPVTRVERPEDIAPPKVIASLTLSL